MICLRTKPNQIKIKYQDRDNRLIFVLSLTWKNSVNTVIEDIGKLLNSRALKSLREFERERSVLHLMSNPGQRSSLPTLPPTPGMKQTLSPCSTHSQTQRSNHRWKHECSYWQRRKKHCSLSTHQTETANI